MAVSLLPAPSTRVWSWHPPSFGATERMPTAGIKTLLKPKGGQGSPLESLTCDRWTDRTEEVQRATRHASP